MAPLSKKKEEKKNPYTKEAEPTMTSPPKSASPTRKAKTKRESSTYSTVANRAEQVKFKLVGIEDVAVAMFFKSNGTDPSYLGNILSFVKTDEQKLESCKATTFTYLRNPDGTNVAFQKANKSGNSYPVDICVISTDGEIPVSQACTNLAKTLGEIAKTECKAEFNYGIPVFINKGDCTPPTVLPLCHYLMDYDCITVIKRIYEGAETKEELMENPERDNILKIVFGVANKGFEVLEGITDEIYEQL